MAFEIIEPGHFGSVAAIEAGRASLQRSGVLTLVASDMAAAGIDATVTVLADRTNLRVALRRPLPADGDKVYRVQGGKGKNAENIRRRTVNLARSLKTLGLDPFKLAGHYELHKHTDNGETLLILNLTELSGQEKEAANRKPAEHMSRPRFEKKGQ